MKIKAVDTTYKGYCFRSRLEARWAVFFDSLGLEWCYEPEGIEFENGERYLPDFWIDYGTDEQYWIEIKAHRNLSEREFTVAYHLAKHHPGYVLCGQPEAPQFDERLSVAMAVKPNPPKDYKGSWAFSFGKPISGTDECVVDHRMHCWHERRDGSITLWPVPSFEPMLLQDPETALSTLKDGWIDVSDLLNANPLGKTKWIDSPALLAAYTAARSARFEFGGKRP